MSSVSSATSVASLFSNSASSQTATKAGSQSLNENDFLQLLTQQLQNQDPLQPQDNTQFIAQMAQFSTLQETNTTNQQIERINAASYLNQTVTIAPSAGAATITGTVQAVDTSGTDPKLVVNGTEYALSTVQLIQPTVTQATTTPASSTTTSG